MPKPGLPIILYHYAYSPFARRVVWYLHLRGIPYSQCMQPPILPRQDLTSLGVKYRRIPILSIGRDIYLDTRLIIAKLEALYPSLPRLTPSSSPETLAITRLLQILTIDAGVFTSAMALLPPSLPLLQDPRFQKDRVDFTGVQHTHASAAAVRVEAVTEIKSVMSFLESTLLPDGRDWLLNTSSPSLADIEAIWPLHWLAGLPGALPPDQVSASHFPKVYSWIGRFQGFVSERKKGQEKPETLSGEQARETILSAEWNETEGSVDAGDATVRFYRLEKGTEVEVWPTDTGTGHKDCGRLVVITATEVVIEPEVEGKGVRVHAPRHGFRVRPVGIGEGGAKM